MPTSVNSNAEAAWIRTVREAALKRFGHGELPGPKNEAWRYTPIKNFKFENFRSIATEEFAAQSAYKPPKEVLALVDQASHRIYFYNGVLLEHCSNLEENGEELSISTVRKMTGNSMWAQKYLERPGHKNLGVFADHQQANQDDGVVIRFKGSSPKKVAVVNLYGNIKGVSQQQPFQVCPRHVYFFEENSRVELIELHVAANSLSFFANVASDLILEKNARVSYGLGQWLGEDALAIHDASVELKEGANLEWGQFSVASAPNRNEMHCELLEKGASVQIYASYAATDRQHIDNSSSIFHRQGETRSEQVVKGVVSGRARAVFSGALRIDEDAQKSDASQLNQNLLLTSTAEVDTRPQLEVFADDVKAAHGASVGELSADEIFYLQSRGLPLEMAKLILGRGYILDVVNRLSSDFVKNGLSAMVDRIPAHYFVGEGEP
jgi:Fe-S cluster assembly protein SufD